MDTETAILEAAFGILESQGPSALTTRAVCEAAGIKAPTLYHHFGDKDGLEQAMIRRGLADFMRRKQQPPSSSELLVQLRSGWDVALEFALKRPALFSLLWHHARSQPALVADAYALMHARVQRLVDTGRFKVPVDTAALAVWAASQGLLSLVLQGNSRKDIEVISELLFNAVVDKLSSPQLPNQRQGG